MALIVETGTGLANAESYVSVAAANAYHAKRANTAWDALEPEIKEMALRRATEYIEIMFHGRWKGLPSTSTQALHWPRAWVYPDPAVLAALPSDKIPAMLANACAELATRATDPASPLLTDEDPQVVASEAVGPISVAYASSGTRQIRYTIVERMLAQLLDDSVTGMLQTTGALA